MKGALLAAVGAMALLSGTPSSNAATATFGTYNLIYSNFGSSPFGTVTVTDGGTAKVVEERQQLRSATIRLFFGMATATAATGRAAADAVAPCRSTS
jgi:hypothetical protein